MASTDPDINLTSLALTALTAACAAMARWLWGRVDSNEKKLTAVHKELTDKADAATRLVHEKFTAATEQSKVGDREIWSSINDSAKRSEDFRTRILERLGETPTRMDLIEMEKRIMNQLSQLRPKHDRAD